MRAGLADSLRTIFDRLDDRFAISPQRRLTLLAEIEAGPVRPGVFGVYVDLVLALFEERLADGQSLLTELLDTSSKAGPLRVVNLDDRQLGTGQSARYRRLVGCDILAEINPVEGEAFAEAAELVTAAMELLRDGAPEVLAEFRALIRELVLISVARGTDGLLVGGASTFSLWGAQILNADRLCDRLTTAVSLAHETAHTYLFGLARGGRLVDNDDDERHASPLRREPRPMEGVAHATFVLARMIYVLEALIGSGRLRPEEVPQAHNQLRHSQEAFDDGLATVLAHARFTPAGAAAFAQVQRYMHARGQRMAWRQRGFGGR
ncbi:MAG: aKG-HExxH-type peptide beta-hydroxylase [Caulobacterales bacterium]